MVQRVCLLVGSRVYLSTQLQRSLADYDILVRCIVETARRLERSGVREDKFGIRFVQIGANPAATEALGALRVELESAYNFRVRRNFTLTFG